MPSPIRRDHLETVDFLLSRSVMGVCVGLLGVMVVTISASIFSRFVIFTPLNFADPLSKYLMQWMAFLGVGLAIRSGEHVVVDMLVLSLPPSVRRLLILLLNLLVTLLFAVVLYYGILYAWSGRNSSNPFVFNVSMMVPYLAVPVGAFYALVQTNVTTWLALTKPDFRAGTEASGVRT
ncbi:MAG: TRAP transporter small permease [Pseudomonadota bacterium]